MRAEVDLALCVRCCACVAAVPGAFFRDERGEVRGRQELYREDLEDAMEAMADCPVGAIRLIETTGNL